MSDLDQIQSLLNEIRKSLVKRVDAEEFYTQNFEIRKYKALFRAILLREAAAWRFHDLLEQIVFLLKSNHISGSQILMRSAYETMAILVYLNGIMKTAIASVNEFKEFSKKTTQLLLGSKDEMTLFEAINVLTMMKKMNKKYHGSQDRYNHLSETSHPNCEAMLLGYSSSNDDGIISNFENRWNVIYGKYFPAEVMVCLEIFLAEYNEEWIDAYEKLELWMIKNIDVLNQEKIVD